MPKHSWLRGRAVIAAVLISTSASAWAQPGRGPSAAAAPGPNGCGSAQLQPRDGSDPQLQGKGGNNLSDRLAQSGGVICPPGEVDPGMKAPAPETGDKPAIRPPAPGQSPQAK